jgi:sugar O-acyltransferase (sialic acid O-acetyltransferase NeuD family)
MMDNMREKSNQLIIIGDTAFAEIAYEYFTHDSEYNVVAFSVEKPYIKKESLFGLPIVPFEDIQSVFSPNEHSFFAATVYTQMNRLRTRLYNQAKLKGYLPASFISPHAFVWENCKLGEHCFVFENNVIQPFVEIGDNVIFWSGNHIGHHSKIGSHCFISSHVVISGFCNIGSSCFLGVNSTLANNVTIGRDSLIGAGVLVAKDIQDGSLYKNRMPDPEQMTTYDKFKIDP